MDKIKFTDISSINKFLKHSLAFVDPKCYEEKITHPNPMVRTVAIYGLCVLQRKEYIDRIIEILRNDENEFVRVGCIISLIFFEKVDVSKKIQFALDDISDLVKISVIDYHTKKKFFESKEKIVSLINNNNDMIKLFIFDYISSLKLREYKEIIYNEIFSQNPVIVQNAILTLLEMNVFEYNNQIIKIFSKNTNPLIKMAIDWLVSKCK